MSLKTLETVTDQTQSTARNTANNAVASIRRETSITGWANRLLAGAAKKRPFDRRSRDEGVYILSAEDVRRGRTMDVSSFVAPDGYVRRSPVQEVVVDPNYHRRLILRGVLCAAGVAAVVLVCYTLVRFGVIGF